MSGPSVAELRSVCQPQRMLERHSGEHWAGRLYMRRVSVYATWLLVRAGLTPNQVTWAMIVCGVAAGAVLAVGGLAAAAAAAVLVQVYLLLDCSDGEVARWTGRTSIVGVYLDRVGHYFAEAALLVGLGVRAQGSLAAGGWVLIGLAAALGAVLIKVETDLVDVARARSGLPAAEDAASELPGRRLGSLRQVAAATRLHRVVQAVELSMLALLAAAYDAVAGGLTATRVLTVAAACVAGVQLVLHLVSILASRRLR
ncbi:MAG: CDP-alcohol phosphatidyltransferase family protein [Streptosporangiales bacterium]|nr:CDP-alcohol phosphatidyltransferase family protein [Streptosporangiales bacterium]